MLVLGTVSVSFVFSQNTIASLTKFESWNISIVGVRTDNYKEFLPEQKSLVERIRPLIAEAVKKVDTHYFTTTEKYNARELKREDGLSTLGKSLEKILLEEDTKALANETRNIRQERNANKKTRKELEKRIEKLKKLDNADIPMVNQLPVKFIEQLDVSKISLVEDFQTLAIKLDSHVLLYYHVYVLDKFMVVEIFEYNAIQRKSRRLLHTVVDSKNIIQIYRSIQLSLHDAILGTKSAMLKIKALETEGEILYDAKILLNGEIVGFGEIVFQALPAGTHVISIINQAEQRNEVIVLDAGVNALRTYLFDMKIEHTTTIQSNPSNAKVYINSEWVGNTPTVVPKPELISSLEIRVPGYQTHRESITQQTSSVLQVTLVSKNAIPLSDRIKISRKKFYNAFSMFAFSLAGAIVLNGFYINEVNARQIGESQLSSSGKADALVNENAFLYSYIGASAVSVGLGIFTYFRLQKYLETASEYHER